LFIRVVKPSMASSMIPMKMLVKLSKKNGFFCLPPDETAELGKAVYELEKITNYDEGTKTVHIVGKIGDNSFAKITKALMGIETAKRNMFVRLAREALAKNPNQKVVLCFNYSNTIEYVKNALEEFEPLVLDGRTSVIRRTQILDAFQAPNAKYRVLIGNVTVCSTGIDLDDKNGGFPRTAFINPNYSTITLYQLGHRFHRANTLSNADVFFVYGKATPELKVLNALASKSGVMKDVTPEQAEAGVVFPIDMPSFYEMPAESA
jgi:hypothetical protein